MTSEMMAFTFANTKLQWSSMIFGLQNASFCFSEVIEVILGELLGKDIQLVINYIDDILLATDNVKDHIILLEKVLQKIEGGGLKLKPSNSQVESSF